jgi:hypothetical protein
MTGNAKAHSAPTLADPLVLSWQNVMTKPSERSLESPRNTRNSIPTTTTTPKDSTSSSNKSKPKHHGMPVKSNREHDTSSATADDESMIPMSTTTTAAAAAAGTIQHDFVTNALDHCETPRIAYQHLIESVLLELGSDGVSTMTTRRRRWQPCAFGIPILQRSNETTPSSPRL